VPEETFETAVKSDKPSTTAITAAAEPPTPVTPVDHTALWLWSHLREFVRRGVLDGDPNAWLETMLPSHARKHHGIGADYWRMATKDQISPRLRPNPIRSL
jgi:hypothetical protein